MFNWAMWYWCDLHNIYEKNTCIHWLPNCWSMSIISALSVLTSENSDKLTMLFWLWLNGEEGFAFEKRTQQLQKLSRCWKRLISITISSAWYVYKTFIFTVHNCQSTVREKSFLWTCTAVSDTLQNTLQNESLRMTLKNGHSYHHTIYDPGRTQPKSQYKSAGSWVLYPY